MKKILILILLFTYTLSLLAKEVNVYTSRHYDSDELLYQEFTEETGIKVNIISGKGGALLERLKFEGKNSPADIFSPLMRVIYGRFKKRDYFSQ